MANKFFTDANGIKREINITFATIFRVAEKTGYDLLNPGEIQNGAVLSEKLLNDPKTVVEVLAAICEIEDKDAFYSALDGKAYAEAEDAFWNAYSDFFAQAGRDWLVVAIQRSLETRAQAEETAYQTLLGLQNPTFSDSSSLQESITDGETNPSGNSQDLPTQASENQQATEPKSSAQSITRTSTKEKTSDSRATSTPTKKQKAAPQRKSS